MGVNTIKYTIPITIGAITFPSVSPNFIQAKFNGVSNFEFTEPKIKKNIDIISGIFFICSKFQRKDQKAKSKKTKEKTNPKVLFEFIFLVCGFMSN